MQSFVVAIVIPDQEVLEPWAKSKKIPGDFGELCDNEVRLLHLIKKILHCLTVITLGTHYIFTMWKMMSAMFPSRESWRRGSDPSQLLRIKNRERIVKLL